MCRLLIAGGAALAIGVAAAAGGAQAAEGGASPYLKGFRDVGSGIVPPYPGWYASEDVLYYKGDVNRTVLNGRVEFELKADSIGSITSVTYVTDHKIFGGQYAFGAFLPVVNIDVKATGVGPLGNSITRGDSLTALTDIGVVPFTLGWHQGNWHYNTSFAILIPNGPYDPERLANTSKNYWAFMPGLAVTYLDPKSGWDVSGSLTYVSTTENDDTDYDTGDFIHLDTAVSKKTGAFRLGMVAYGMWQTSGDSGAGAVLGPNKAQVYGAGPIVTYEHKFGDHDLNFTAKWYREFGDKNTLKGDTVSLAAAMKF